ncbi:MAG: asparagine synthase (glutamine-hydrolyzing) [Gammaproteobacteria bacterium]|jgi:asparagine synthase (glutamine-hydrolysing)
MCGIAGTINMPSVTKRDVQKMVSSIRHRGVDEAGVEKMGRCILGHVRLAVVDPENGHQPMSNQSDKIWVTFNGEIYNFVELRKELKAKGYVFKSRCDTEVLVHLWEEEGEQMLQRLNGMFAFFLWDSRYDKGILVRDRQGLKPCFVAEHAGGYAYSSEMKAILTLPGFKREVNDEALKEVFCFNYALPNHTCFKKISPLAPGHYLLFEGDKKPQEKKYWEWPFFAEKRASSHDELESLLDDAIRLQMRFDVKGGAYLSGGVDSSVITRRLVEQWNEETLPTIGLNFSESVYSEYEYSQQAATTIGANLDEALISAEMIPQIAEKVSYHAEQPHGDFSFFLLYILAQKAHSENKIVMFTGDGPDEMLSGFKHNEKFFSNLNDKDFVSGDYFDTISYMTPEIRSRVLDRDFDNSTADPKHRFEALLEPWKKLTPREQIIAYECTSLMPGNNSVKGDRMGACWSIEGRAPFLDHRISEMFIRLSNESKFNSEHGKLFLKSYANRYFPNDFIFKKKTMPTTPIGEWIKGPLYSWAYDILASNKDNRFNTKNILSMLRDHKAGAQNYTKELRTLLMTQLWMKNYFAG